MTKRNALSWLLALCLLGGLVAAMPGVAGAADAPVSDETITIVWEDVNDPDNWKVNLTRPAGTGNGNTYGLIVDNPSDVGGGSGQTGSGVASNGSETVDLSKYILWEGEYTVRFFWYGQDISDHADNVNATSLTRTYTKPNAAFGTPRNPKWDDTTAKWEAPMDTVVSQENAMYRVELWATPKDDAGIDEDLSVYDVDVSLTDLATGVDFGDAMAQADDYTLDLAKGFYFTVRVLSGTIGTIGHSAVSVPSSRIKADGTPAGGGGTTPDPVAPAAPEGVAWEAGDDVWTIGFTPKANAQHSLKLYDSANPTTALQTKTVSGTADAKATWDVAAFVRLPANDGKSFLVGVTAIGTPNSAEVKSPLKKYTDPVSAVVEDIVKIVVTPSDPERALSALESAGDAEELYEAMQRDADVAAKIEEIEEAYIAKNTATEPVYDVDASLADIIVGTNANVSAVGLALNAEDTTAAVTLAIDPIAEQDKETAGLTGYENVLQLEIKLTGNVKSTLTVPVTITMPIPEGVLEGNLVILHYTIPGGQPTVITPDRVDSDTVTFTVTSFSTFAFANKAAPSNPGTTGGSGGDGSWPSGYNPVPAAPAAPPASPAPSVPTANFYRVMARTLNERGGPGTNYPVMGKLTQNELIRIVGFSADGLWAQTDSGTWLSMAYLSGTSAVSGAGNFTVNVSSSLNVRSGAGTNSATIGKLYAGAAVRALSVEKGWALIEYNGGTAYVSAMYLK